MKTFVQRNHRLLFYSFWIILGLIQSAYTELQDDEAYYWVYSRFLDWGYFDHPPMIAVLVKLGYSIFPNELGVRLLPLLLNVLSLAIIERLTTRKNPFLFYAIALSIAVLQISGFVAVPDIPLIFFTALFFLCYKRFIGNFSLFNTLLLAVSAALLFYSKYHAVLIIFFTLLSNIKLFTRYQIYLAGIIAMVLFVPHLWWQYQHDWVSFRYHLFESNVHDYKFRFTGDYILGQLLLPGPIAGIILLPAAFLYQSQNKVEKALRYTMIGIYVFFLLSTLRGQVEGNWTSPVVVSLIVLSHQYINGRLKWQRALLRLLPITLALVLFARIVMIVDILPLKIVKQRYHAWKDWPKEMNTRTKGLPVVFSNSYQRASKYWFYSGQETYSQNWVGERRNNYNFWPVEDSMLGKPVYFLDIYRMDRLTDSIQTPIGDVGYKYDPAFASFAKVNIVFAEKKFTLHTNDSLVIHAETEMPALYRNFISAHDDTASRIAVAFLGKDKWIKTVESGLTLHEASKGPFTITVDPQLPKGKYLLRMSITNIYNDTHNSDKVPLVIE